MPEPMVEVQGLSHFFGDQEVLKNLGFRIEPGTILGLLGPSGSGKTTLIRAMTGLLRPSQGKVLLAGHEVPSAQIAPLLGYMAQTDGLYDDLTGEENLSFFAALNGIRGKGAKVRMTELFALTELAGHEKKLVKHYSGGMRKRLSLAITLVHKPCLLFLDEPTVGIDPVLRAGFWKEFRLLAGEGTTIVLSTHVMDEAANCDLLALLFEGEVLAWDSPRGLMKTTDTRSVEEAFLSLRKPARAGGAA